MPDQITHIDIAEDGTLVVTGWLDEKPKQWQLPQSDMLLILQLHGDGSTKDPHKYYKYAYKQKSNRNMVHQDNWEVKP